MGLMDPLRRLLDAVSERIGNKLLMLLSNEARIRALRKRGVRIGEGCVINTNLFSTEPYLVDIGNRVAVSAGTTFITHDATGFIFKDQPNMDLFGRIEVGDDTFFGLNTTILPGTRIGRQCVIGTGAVVRGEIPDGSVVMGNPAQIVMKTSLLKELMVNHKHRLDTCHLPAAEKEKVLRRHFGLE